MSDGRAGATGGGRRGGDGAIPGARLRGTLASLATVAPPRSALARVGLGIVLFYLAVAIFAPWLAPHDPAAYSGNPLERPSAAHPLGTNDVGQDILSELVYGARIALLLAAAAGGLTLALAALVGLTAGYFGGLVDALLMRLVDVLLAIPHLPLMIILAAYLGSRLINIILIIALLGWMVPARVIRAQVRSLRGQGHIQAARLFDGGPTYIIRRHLIPALAPILAATFVAQAGRAIGVEAGLAFLGPGDPSAKSWGLMIRYALDYRGIYFTPHWLWWLLPAGLNISLLILGFTCLGIALEARLDPRLRRHAGAARAAGRRDG